LKFKKLILKISMILRIHSIILILLLPLIACQEQNYIPKDEHESVFISYDKEGNRKDVSLQEINNMLRGKK